MSNLYETVIFIIPRRCKYQITVNESSWIHWALMCISCAYIDLSWYIHMYDPLHRQDQPPIQTRQGLKSQRLFPSSFPSPTKGLWRCCCKKWCDFEIFWVNFRCQLTPRIPQVCCIRLLSGPSIWPETGAVWISFSHPSVSLRLLRAL